jgi:hypothetical protein
MTRKAPLLLALLLVGVTACQKEKTCSSDLALCSGHCTSLATDAANCGACGHSCAKGESCSGGSCSCDATTCGGASWEGKRSAGTTCGNACVDLASDPANCGACGNACAGGLLCTTNDAGNAECASDCLGTGQTACGRACVNLQTHRWNCGACGRACGSKECCFGGRCVADLYLACYNSDEVREATGSLEAAGIPIDTAPGPIGLAWASDLLAVASAKWNGAETLAMVHLDPPGVRRTDVLEPKITESPDIEFLVEHGGLLYVAHTSLGTLLIATPTGAIVDEVRLAPVGALDPSPLGIAFDGDKAFIALNARDEVVVLDVSGVSSCVAGTRQPPCTSELARVDVHPLASPSANAMPSRIAIAGGRAFVTLWNLTPPPAFTVPPGGTGRLAAIRTADGILDADFAGTTNGLIDLGAGCLNPADVAAQGGELYVTCGAFDYSNFPNVAIHGAGIVPVDVSGTVAQVLPAIAPSPDPDRPWAPGKLAFCGPAGYVGDRNTGRVLLFDPASGATTLPAGVDLCPMSNGYAYVADIACGR